MGAFIAFVFVWDLFPAGIHFLRYGAFPGSGHPPDWYFFLGRLNPIDAYVEALTVTFRFLETELLHGVACFLHPSAMLFILVTWTVLALIIGYGRFRMSDIR